MFTGLALFASVFGSSADQLSGVRALTSERVVLGVVLAFLAAWILYQGVFWACSKIAVRRIIRNRGSKRQFRRAKKAFRRAAFQLKVSMFIVVPAFVFCGFQFAKDLPRDGEFLGRLVDRERVSGFFKDIAGNIFVESEYLDGERSTARKTAADKTMDECRELVDRQAEKIDEFAKEASGKLVENKAAVSEDAPKVESETGRYPGEVVFVPYVKSDDEPQVQQENVSGKESEDVRMSQAVRVQDAQAPSRLQSSTSRAATPALDLQSSVEPRVARPSVTSIPASQLDSVFFAEREDFESQRRLGEYFTPEKPLAPFPKTYESSSRSKARSVNYEEQIDDGTSAGLIEGIWTADELDVAGNDDEKSILVRIDEEANRISSLVRACVLPIETRKSTPGSRVVEEETGCGFLTQYKGKTYVVTNNHVVDHAVSNDSIKVFLPNNQTISPTRVFPCDDFDLAALEVPADRLPKDGSVTLCRFGDSDSVRVANSVFAIGNPFGLEKSLSYGHVSSLRRCNRDLVNTNQNLLPEYIQIDAAINPGNSGGPLYDSRGDVVGIVTAIATTSGKNEGVAFAIPINVALRVVKTTIDGGVWRRSRLGVELEAATRADLTATHLPYVFGAKIVEVTAQSPAQNAGLKPGDVVLSFNGKQVENDVHLARLIALADASELVKIGVLRGSNYFEIGAKLERASASN